MSQLTDDGNGTGDTVAVDCPDDAICIESTQYYEILNYDTNEIQEGTWALRRNRA